MNLYSSWKARDSQLSQIILNNEKTAKGQVITGRKYKSMQAGLLEGTLGHFGKYSCLAVLKDWSFLTAVPSHNYLKLHRLSFGHLGVGQQTVITILTCFQFIKYGGNMINMILCYCNQIWYLLTNCLFNIHHYLSFIWVVFRSAWWIQVQCSLSF